MESALQIPDSDAPLGIAVRPDLLLISVSARIEEIAPTQALVILRGAATHLATRVAAIQKDVEIEPRKLDLGRQGSHDKAGKITLADAQLDGTVRIPLDAAADFWARAELVARITELFRAIRTEWSKAKPTIRFGFRQPVARLRDTAPHRAELTARYAAQLRALLGGNGGIAASAVNISNWEIPDEVVQTMVSLDEVRLTLAPTRKTAITREL